jgi:leader peptidase (prepilin peptidase)/N-methyltransferase
MSLADFPDWFVIGVAVLLGLAFGSFTNVVIHRLPREQSVVHPGSRCPNCGAAIAIYDNIPVLSWIVLRGRARCCGVRISPRYALVETMGGLLGWALAQTLVLELSASTTWWQALLIFLLYLAFGFGLIAIAFIDLEHMIVPDEITIGGTLLGIITVAVRPEIEWLDALLGAAVGFLVVWVPFDLLYRALRGQAGMGLGDAKLLMLAGAWFGWPAAVFALLAGSVQGTVVALTVFLVKGRIEEPEAVRRERQDLIAQIEAAPEEQRQTLEDELARDPIGRPPEPGLSKARLAFGPFLALAVLEYMLFARAFVDDYLSGVWP